MMRPVLGQLRVALGILICATLASADSPRSAPAPEGLQGKVYFLTKSNLQLPDFSRLEPALTIYTNPIRVASNYDRGFPGIPNRVAWFAIDYAGKIYIGTPGDYDFTLASDDGSKLYIDDQVVINNDHGLGDWTGQKRVHLGGGMHRIRLSYLQGPQGHHCITLLLNVTFPKSHRAKPFDLRDFHPPAGSGNWKYGSPSDFDDPPDPDAGRVRLKDAITPQTRTTTHKDAPVNAPAELRGEVTAGENRNATPAPAGPNSPLFIEGDPSPKVPTFETTVFGTTTFTRGDLEGKIYFIPPVRRLPRLSKLKSVGTIYAKSLNVPLTEFREGFPGITDRFEWFAIEYTGTFYVNDPGNYYFRLRSDDGSKLFIDGKAVIELDNLGRFEAIGSKKLAAGVHDIRVDYFQGPRYHLQLTFEVQLPGAKRFQLFNTDDFVLRSGPAPSASPSNR